MNSEIYQIKYHNLYENNIHTPVCGNSTAHKHQFYYQCSVEQYSEKCNAE